MKTETKITYLALMANFILLVLMMTIPVIRQSFQGKIFLVPFATFFFIGLLLSISSFQEKTKDKTRKFLMITGGSAVGIFVGVILHNLVYGLMIIIFGADIWRRLGVGDEPVFFILSLLVLPGVFIIAAVGSAILLVKKNR